MSNSGKIIIAILSFIVCAALGYFGMSFLSSAKEKSQGQAVPSAQSYSSGVGRSTSSGGSSKSGRFPESGITTSNSSNSGANIQTPTPATVTDIGSETASTQRQQEPPSGTIPTRNTTLGSGIASMPEILEVTSPQYNESSKTYSFRVIASGQNLTYTVADARKRDVQSNETGSFTVQPSATGKYYVYITDGRGNKTEYTEVKGCYRPVNKVLKDELQLVLNSGNSQNAIDADFANRVSSGCRYDFTGISEDEVPPASYNEIINRIRMKTWSSVTVLSVTHSSETNKLVRARIQVNY